MCALLWARFFEELNNNGITDVSFPGVVIELWTSTGNKVNTSVTDVTGNFTFTVPPGVYVLREATPPGFVAVRDSDGGNPSQIEVVNVTIGDDLDNVFIVARLAPSSTPGLAPTTSVPGLPQPTLVPGFAPSTSSPASTFPPSNSQPAALLGSICGNVTVDLNGDGTGDSALPGVNITLLNGNFNVAGSLFTDSSGTYCFVALSSGNYSVIQTPLPGYVEESDTQGNPLDNLIQVYLDVGTKSTGNNFCGQTFDSQPQPKPKHKPKWYFWSFVLSSILSNNRTSFVSSINIGTWHIPIYTYSRFCSIVLPYANHFTSSGHPAVSAKLGPCHRCPTRSRTP